MNQNGENKKSVSTESITTNVNIDIYRLNPFKILGLSPKASLLEAEKRADKLRTMQRLGIKDSNDLPEDVGDQEIRDAIECLRDPRKRILNEIFWHDLEVNKK